MTNVKLVEEHYRKYLKIYEYWSGKDGGGYHFGFANNLWEIFDNAKMTKNLSDLVIEKLDIDYHSPQVVLDAGCGAGHVGRILAKKFKNGGFQIHGITLSREQIELGEQLNKKEHFKNNLFLSLGDFEKTAYPNDFFDAVFFIDSICCGDGINKSNALKEAFRVLRPGGTIVVSDGFLLKKEDDIDFLGKYFSKKLLKVWDVENWADKDLFFKEMAKTGFEDIKSENLSSKIVPSVLHVSFFKLPGLAIRFLKRETEGYEIKFSFLVGIFAPLLGIHPSFEYKIVTAKKAKS